MIPPSKISTKLKEMQFCYDLLQAQRQKIHTHYLVSCWFSFHSFKAVVSTGQFRDKKQVHGSLFSNSNRFSGNITLHSLKLVLFQFRTPEGWAKPWALPGTGWYTAGARSRVPVLRRGRVPLCCLRHLLKSHQVCWNLLFVTLAGCTQMLKP